MIARHWAFSVLLASAAVLLGAFAWQSDLASVGDDSASYLVLAHSLAGDPLAGAWEGYHTHFPPLFPAVLALVGGAWELGRAHLAVAAAAALALVPIHAFVLRESKCRSASVLSVATFLLLPSAWLAVKPILSEPQYLLASMGAIAWFEYRLADGSASARDALVFGVLLAATVLTRAVGVALIAAFVAHTAVRAIASGSRPSFPRVAAALLPTAILVAAWMALRHTAGGDSYERVSAGLAQSWLAAPALMAAASAHGMTAGWTAGFTADPDVGVLARIVASAAGVLALAGLALRLAHNRLDAWYVAISLAILAGWVFREENTRRLLYPLLPLLLYYAGSAIATACSALRRAHMASPAIAAGAAFLAVICVPAMLLIAGKALDREPVYGGLAPRYADMLEYYTTIEGARARALAARHAAVLAGLEAIERDTPASSRVMWMRPEYIALIARREGVPWLYKWGPERLAREVRDANVDYIVATQLFKSDLEGRRGDPGATLAGALDYARPVLALRNPVAGTDDFVLLRVDRTALEQALARKEP